MEERIRAVGHEHVRATHASTFEVTTDDFLTPAGDCILAIRADKAPADFAPRFVNACRDEAATITAQFRVADQTVTVTGRGHPDLTFASERAAVGRTSDHVDDRTVMVGADAAAVDLPRSLVAPLAAGADLEVEFRVER